MPVNNSNKRKTGNGFRNAAGLNAVTRGRKTGKMVFSKNLYSIIGKKYLSLKGKTASLFKTIIPECR